MKQADSLFETIFSFAVFAVITLGVASTTYQVFNPDGGLVHWVLRVWDANPVLLIMIGGIMLLVKRWLDGTQDSRSSEMMFYGALLLGTYYGFNLLIAA